MTRSAKVGEDVKIRIAKRLRLGGRDLGLLLINVQAARMLKEFADNRGKAADHIMLFNQDGYWLRSPDPSREWGLCSSVRISP